MFFGSKTFSYSFGFFRAIIRNAMMLWDKFKGKVDLKIYVKWQQTPENINFRWFIELWRTKISSLGKDLVIFLVCKVKIK